MKWFKHISDSLDDPFIFSLIEEFGSDGYLVFFGILEVYAREFSTKDEWILTEKQSYFRHKLGISRKKLKKILLKITKWDVSFTEDKISIFIPKFRELMDESTLKKLRAKEISFRNRSGTVPKTATTDADADIEEDKDNISSEPEKEQATEPPDSPVLEIPLIKKDGSFLVYQLDIDQWQDTYPGIDVLQALKQIRQWNLDNPTKRKTKGGIRKHISTWLGREQDKGGNKFNMNNIQPKSVKEIMRQDDGYKVFE